ncbi:hypothetical protein FB566_3277 [Stackebrandtia endophytica]|uniref:Uncharacterized protein n=1 Tax=Stackebrandtia endophytica TaxID=1496996 RepID=A0A543AYR4_9ACTN|nr:hypothetical protein [Stackebrandtia endophytica]TQL77714.1 hypothetical protein FB566_3277 [Stackebrandtia endophytica]
MNRPTQSELRAKGDEVAVAAANAMSRLMPWLGGTDRFRDLFLESFQGVPDRFARFGESNPERLDAMLASMEYTMTSLSHQDIQDMSMVQNTIGPWEGNAADAFYENYVTPFSGINTNHQDLARELALALEAAVAVIDKSRRDVMRIGDGTIEVLNGLERSGGGGDSGWSTALTVVAAVATLHRPLRGPRGRGDCPSRSR